MHETVIRNFQDTILDNFDKILTFNQISLDLNFIPVQPWAVDDEEKMDDEQIKTQ